MITLDDLGQVALDLRKRGVDAAHDFLYSPHGCIEGLDVDDEFFPLWELRLQENVADAVTAFGNAQIIQVAHSGE